MEVGVLGGTFDPVHMGHLIIAEEARLQLSLERVLFIPAARPWMKGHRSITIAEHRMAMLRLAIATNPLFHISTVELDTPGPSYTIYTLRTLKQELGETAHLYFILGMDSLYDLPQWREPRGIVKYSQLVVFPRQGCEQPEWPVLEATIPEARKYIEIIKGPIIEISSSEIRRRIAQGLSIRYLVPEAVERYIYEKGLYRD